MIASRSTSAPLPRLAWRWVAALCGVLVWALGLLSANPELHSSLHDDAGHTDHVCAVTLFSQGTENPTVAMDFVVAPTVTVIARLIPTDPIRVESPEDWLQPGRGPPAC